MRCMCGQKESYRVKVVELANGAGTVQVKVARQHLAPCGLPCIWAGLDKATALSHAPAHITHDSCPGCKLYASTTLDMSGIEMPVWVSISLARILATNADNTAIAMCAVREYLDGLFGEFAKYIVVDIELISGHPAMAIRGDLTNVRRLFQRLRREHQAQIEKRMAA